MQFYIGFAVVRLCISKILHEDSDSRPMMSGLSMRRHAGMEFRMEFLAGWHAPETRAWAGSLAENWIFQVVHPSQALI